jgi:hypothetical protein
VDKPFIGSAYADPDVPAVGRACRLMQMSSVSGLACAAALVAAMDVAFHKGLLG